MVGPHDNFSRCITYDLETLDLSMNNIKGILSPWFGNLTNLKHLNLGGNDLHGPIPTTLGHLTSLKFLRLSETSIEGVLSDVHLANLSSLEQLYIDDTLLKWSIASDWLPPFQLRVLSLRSIRIQGHFPLWIGTQHELVRLNMSGNLLMGQIPEFLGRCNKLKYLDLSSNFFKGMVFNYLVNLSSSSTLRLSNNPLGFNFSHDWEPPFQLEEFHMRSCEIQGELPQWIETQNNLQSLDLSNNSISGRMLDWSRNINLHELDLSYNHILGPITQFPLELGVLDLSHNWLSGPLSQDISTSLCQLSQLELLNLQSNSISGSIPHDCWVNSSYSLDTINLSFNDLSGVIPSSIGLLSWLAFLNLNKNSLEGKIPLEFTSCGWLEILDIGENKLTGEVPSFGYESSPYMQILRLRDNQLGGNIPRKLCSLRQLRILDLAGNNLTGGIPHCFGQLEGMGAIIPIGPPSVADAVAIPPMTVYPQEENVMEVLKGEELEYTSALKYVENLDLSCNALVGTIPDEIAHLTALIGLNLSYNHLSGRIPQRIGELKSLESLDLSNNNLSGVIPSSMSTLNFLSHLNLSHNKLHGEIPTEHQLQTLNDPSMYAGNLGLCGDPLPEKCTRKKVHQGHEEVEEEEKEVDDPREKVLFYLVEALGFGAGFWGVVGTLLLKKQLRNEKKDPLLLGNWEKSLSK